LKWMNCRPDVCAASANHAADADFVSAGGRLHAARPKQMRRQERQDIRQDGQDGKNIAPILDRPALPAYPAAPALTSRLGDHH